MKLSELSREITNAELTGPDIEINGIHFDSRAIIFGNLFVAVPGLKSDGSQFVADAIRRGAVAVLCHSDAMVSSDIPTIRVSNVRRGMAEAAWFMCGHAERELVITAITGTNGKTTTATILQQILQRARKKTGLIGTLGASYGDYTDDGVRTTPEAIDIAKYMRSMRKDGVSHLVMEATSIGIDLERLWELPIAVAVFTNLTRDHLDYHVSESAYLQAKSRLFSERRATDACVINADDNAAESLTKSSRGKVKTYGISHGDMVASEIELTAHGSRFLLSYRGRKFPVQSPLLGRFNVYNLLAALMAADCLDTDLVAAIETMRTVKAARGRAEVVPSSAPFSVIVDYAHTPDALEKILAMTGEFKPQRLIAVIGAGGDRDRGKRPLMGQSASRYATDIIVTSDNPRGENPLSIMKEIESGIAQSTNYRMIEDRREAIDHAIRKAGPQSIVVIAGKGHETYQEVSGVKYPFDDCVVAGESLRELGY